MEARGKKILILGAGVMQLPAIRAAKALGLSVIVVDGAADPPGKELADRFERIDLKDQAAMIEFALGCKAKGGLDGVFTAGTDFSHAVAVIAKAAGLPGMPPLVALGASVKSRMRETFRKNGVPSPNFIVVADIEDFKADPDKPGFPVVVKPVDSMGGRGCLRIDAEKGMDEAIRDAVSHSRSGKAIVEEYIEGPEFSVDALVWKGEIFICGLADRHIFFPPHFVEMGHTIPTAFPQAAQEEILRVFRLGVKALGIDNGAAKGDIKLGPDGKARVGEIAARLSGGYMSGWTYPYSSGVELTRAGIRIALGLEPGDLKPKLALVSAERAWISIPGKVREMRGVENARIMQGVREIFYRLGPGDSARFPRNNVEKCGNVIAVDADRNTAVRCAQEAAAAILLRLEPDHPETEAFLARRGSPYPPDAFAALPADLEAAIASMPADDPGRSQAGSRLSVRRLPGADEYSGKDWQGREFAEAAAIALHLAGAEYGDSGPRFGKGFWLSLIRGSYQGGAYHIDTARKRNA
jgi:biotin carboxylase